MIFQAHELLTHRLSEWSELCKNPTVLPESSEQVIEAFRSQQVRASGVQRAGHRGVPVTAGECFRSPASRSSRRSGHSRCVLPESSEQVIEAFRPQQDRTSGVQRAGHREYLLVHQCTITELDGELR